ncbi:hypothetical protein Tco_0712926 [Tanacetum coccineum]
MTLYGPAWLVILTPLAKYILADILPLAITIETVILTWRRGSSEHSHDLRYVSLPVMKVIPHFILVSLRMVVLPIVGSVMEGGKVLDSKVLVQALRHQVVNSLTFGINNEDTNMTSLYNLSPFSQIILGGVLLPSAGEAVAWPAEGTSLVVAPDVFSTTKLELVKLESPLEVPIECSSVQQPGM